MIRHMFSFWEECPDFFASSRELFFEIWLSDNTLVGGSNLPGFAMMVLGRRMDSSRSRIQIGVKHFLLVKRSTGKPGPAWAGDV
jgi:hypothetical protein